MLKPKIENLPNFIIDFFDRFPKEFRITILNITLTLAIALDTAEENEAEEDAEAVEVLEKEKREALIASLKDEILLFYSHVKEKNLALEGIFEEKGELRFIFKDNNGIRADNTVTGFNSFYILDANKNILAVVPYYDRDHHGVDLLGSIKVYELPNPPAKRIFDNDNPEDRINVTKEVISALLWMLMEGQFSAICTEASATKYLLNDFVYKNHSNYPEMVQFGLNTLVLTYEAWLECQPGEYRALDENSKWTNVSNYLYEIISATYNSKDVVELPYFEYNGERYHVFSAPFYGNIRYYFFDSSGNEIGHFYAVLDNGIIALSKQVTLPSPESELHYDRSLRERLNERLTELQPLTDGFYQHLKLIITNDIDGARERLSDTATEGSPGFSDSTSFARHGRLTNLNN